MRNESENLASPHATLYAILMNIVIMAGGGGTRLWPLSRQATPKQFLDLGSGQTLIQKVLTRGQALTDINNIYVATNQDYREHIQQQLPAIDASHIFYEPEKRDTAAAFASIVLRLQHLGHGNEPVTFMWSDHIFTDEESFLTDLKQIPNLLAHHPDHIVIVGHNPITPETTLGYMEVGDALEGYDNIYHLKQFKEKPDRPTAEQFLTAGNYYWNLGYFSFRPDYFVRELQTQSPEFTEPMAGYLAALTSGDATAITEAYGNFPKISIDYALIEKTDRLLAITGDYGWSDVGNWAIVKEVFGRDGDHMPYGHHLHVNSANNYIYNTTDKVVSLLGVKDTIVIVTDDAILITNPKHASQAKDVVIKLEEDGKTDVL